MFKAKKVFLGCAIVLNFNLWAAQKGNLTLGDIDYWNNGEGRLLEFQIAGKQARGHKLSQEDKLNLQRIRRVKAFVAGQKAELEALAHQHRIQQAQAFAVQQAQAFIVGFWEAVTASDISGFKSK